MLVKLWRLVTVMLIGLSMGPALCHLLEMPAKMTYDGSLWLTLLHTLYPPAFGTVGAFFEVGAVVTAVALAFLVRQRLLATAQTEHLVLLTGDERLLRLTRLEPTLPVKPAV